ncbi:MAG TPA: hypothetical protein PLU72_12465 [Candidatus Ozemobacteraceae bacterium]|nr:hypothetical protein [Candidatus Ozemobacteraceae bacterium]
MQRSSGKQVMAGVITSDLTVASTGPVQAESVAELLKKGIKLGRQKLDEEAASIFETALKFESVNTRVFRDSEQAVDPSAAPPQH